MDDRSEILVTSDASGVLCTASIWDAYSGTALMNYKGGGTTGAHCLAMVGNDYLICAEKSKPIIHVWPLNSQEVTRNIERIVTPGCVNTLCISPKNNYCIIAISEKLYIWDLMGGELLTVTTRHFRPITCLKFTDDGSHFISAGQDGMVIVWPLVHLVSYHATEFLMQANSGQPEPRYTFSDHSLSVTDIHVGHGGIQAFVVSVSGDQTCKLYSLADGILILSVVFNSSLSAVTMSIDESEVFVGDVNGVIYSFDIQRMPRSLDHHMTKEQLSQSFLGHSKAITNLSTSLNGHCLVSGSADDKVIIWDIKSKQCLKILHHKGPVTNAFFSICPKHIFSNTFKPTTIIHNFKKSDDGVKCVKLIRRGGLEVKTGGDKNILNEFRVSGDSSVVSGDLQSEVIQLQEINKQLYTFAVNKLLNKRI